MLPLNHRAVSIIIGFHYISLVISFKYYVFFFSVCSCCCFFLQRLLGILGDATAVEAIQFADQIVGLVAPHFGRGGHFVEDAQFALELLDVDLHVRQRAVDQVAQSRKGTRQFPVNQRSSLRDSESDSRANANFESPIEVWLG